ncbi:MAG: integrase arm-type DNA-binding domain-containing protein, partial [Novosphingobium sp.]
MPQLTELKARNAKPGTHGDGAGLYLRVKDSGAKSWVLRVQFQGRRQDIGLGGYPADRSLGEARDEAARLRKLARRGGNAIAARDHVKVSIPSFAEAVASAHAELGKGWSVKNAASFKASLDQHMVPRLGKKSVNEIGSADVIAALSPVWIAKPHLAKKLRVRTLQVLSFARARGWREAPLPDPRELRDGLASQPRSKNFAAMPYASVPAFMAGQLSKPDTAGRLALLFTIATAARSGETRAATWDQVDLDARTWTRPAEMMKSRLAHVVTLNGAALTVLKRAAAAWGTNGLIFPGARQGSSLSDM